MVSCQRLLDVVDHVESDSRIQTMFTVAPDAFNHDLHWYLRSLGAVVLPWCQAVRERFDLALAAAYNGLHEIHAPLVVMAHGAGHGKLGWTGPGGGPPLAQPPVYGLDAPRLTRDGRVLASALLLSHVKEREVLRRQCPEALRVATVVGDPCLDRLLASVPLRARYRDALGLGGGQELVVVASTWGSDGLFGHAPHLLPRLMHQLPTPHFHVAVLLHPAVWAAHGRRQVRAWLRDCTAAGLLVLDPTEDWRALVIAADYLIGDHGSVTAYAAAIGRRIVHLAPTRPRVLAAGSPQDLVTTSTTRLDTGEPILPQLRAVKAVDGGAVTASITSHPGRADILIRRSLYRLLGLQVPGAHRRARPAPTPQTCWTDHQP